METSWMERTSLLIGNKGLEKLNNAHVLVVGLGGVGSYAAEAIGRSGVGKMTILTAIRWIQQTGTDNYKHSPLHMALTRLS